MTDRQETYLYTRQGRAQVAAFGRSLGYIRILFYGSMFVQAIEAKDDLDVTRFEFWQHSLEPKEGLGA